jgi:exopolysaccharide production protein ExoY
MKARIGPAGGIAKRAFDCAASLAALVIMSPIMLMVALLILATMGRPIFTAQRSIGFRKSLFCRLTFRTAIAANAHAPPSSIEEALDPAAPRVTWLGNMLRESGLDRLPQLFNILCGHMSLIGPQCLPASELTCCPEHMRAYAKARPGLVGLWQIDLPTNAIHSSSTSADCYYVRRWSPALDMFILTRTILGIRKAPDAGRRPLRARIHTLKSIQAAEKFTSRAQGDLDICALTSAAARKGR